MLLIGSPMCCIIMIKSQNVVERQVGRPGGQGVIMTMMRDERSQVQELSGAMRETSAG